jgi:hypothetical protein
MGQFLTITSKLQLAIMVESLNELIYSILLAKYLKVECASHIRQMCNWLKTCRLFYKIVGLFYMPIGSYESSPTKSIFHPHLV